MAAAIDPVFEASPLGMARVDASARVLAANAALHRLLGYTPGELTREPLRRVVHPDDHALEAASRARVLAGGGAEQVELRLLHRTGGAVPVRVTRCAVDGTPAQGLLLVDQVEDLGEVARAQREIVLLNNLLQQRIRSRSAELEESSEDLREFAYSIAHDLRGPLSSIDGFSAQLAESLGGGLDERGRHFVQRIRAGVRRMSQLTDGLLTLAGLSQAQPRHEAVDLSAIARAQLDALQAADPARGVEVLVHDTPAALGDPVLLARLMDELLGNAWKFSAARQPARIGFAAHPLPEGGVAWEVTDNGTGFDEAYAARLFRPFQRLHTRTEFEGVGIGLALVRKIVTRHGGRVWAESRPGEGTRVAFTLG